jgi:Amt family ammonium transporter
MKNYLALRCLLAGAATTLAATPAWAQESTIDPADTTWITVSTALVLMMTLPGLALLYAGMVRKKHMLAVMAQCLGAAILISMLWAIAGYSLAFTGDGEYIGSLDRLFLMGMGLDSVNAAADNIPESLFMIFQMTFAIITVALIAGSVADRMKFSAFLWFSAAWFFVVYVPVAHWVWGGGFLGEMGLLDFAGGTVVHLNCGIAGLVACIMLGARRGYGKENMPPHDLTLAVAGTALLWVGWFGFNGGSALAAGSAAVMAIVVTHLAAAAGALAWMAVEWWSRGKASVLGIVSGAIAGLATVTPASGFVLPWHGVVIGVVAGVASFYACTWLKQRLNYDDALDVFGLHGVGGVIGTLATGVFATTLVNEAAADASIVTQAIGIAVVGVWCAVGSFVVLKLVDLAIGLRVSTDAERIGLDVTLHGEALQ